MIILKLFTIILLTLILWVIFRVVFGVFKIVAFFKSSLQSQMAQPSAAAHHSQNTMVKCASCELYVLDHDAIMRNGLYFCSQEHAKMHT